MKLPELPETSRCLSKAAITTLAAARLITGADTERLIQLLRLRGGPSDPDLLLKAVRRELASSGHAIPPPDPRFRTFLARIQQALAAKTTADPEAICGSIIARPDCSEPSEVSDER